MTNSTTNLHVALQNFHASSFFFFFSFFGVQSDVKLRPGRGNVPNEFNGPQKVFYLLYTTTYFQQKQQPKETNSQAKDHEHKGGWCLIFAMHFHQEPFEEWVDKWMGTRYE